MPVVITLEYGTLAIEVGLDFNFAVVFLLTQFLFCQVQRNYQAIGMSIGQAHRTLRCASQFELGWRWIYGEGDVEEIEMVREMRGDGDI